MHMPMADRCSRPAGVMAMPKRPAAIPRSAKP